MAVCTLKDAVKLGPLWPRNAPPLWYLSQAVVVERGAAPLHEALRRLVPDSQP
jgi:tetraacyldisaccharide 4'-kinase